MGKKYIRKSAASLTLLVILCLRLDGAALVARAAGDVRLEGVTARLPNVTVYCYPSDPQSLEGAHVTYGGEPLTVSQCAPYANLGSGSDYYMLMDVSGSLSEGYFSCMKEAVLDFFRNMGKNDKLTLIAFGDEVRVVFEGKTAGDDVEGAVRALENKDQTTRLFDAIHQTAKLCDKEGEADVRKVAVVFTDGEDFSENTSTKAEALAALSERRIPLYAMAAREIYGGKENACLEGMGEFVRETGGIMEIFDTSDALTKMQGLQRLFGEAWAIVAKARTNAVDHEKKLLAVTLSDGRTLTAKLRAAYSQKDETAPTASMEQASDASFRVTFSEPVHGADQVSAYEVTRDGDAITDGYMARYQESEEGASAELVFDEALWNGRYELSFHGITDASMEGNALTGKCELEVTDGRTMGLVDYFMKYQAASVGAAVLLVFFSALFMVWHKMKKRKGVVTIEGKAVLRSNVQKKHHVAVKKRELSGRQILFCLEGALFGQRQITVNVVNSMIVGRSQICDLSIEDEKMSRQHFAIHDKNGCFYIEDLHTTNGTLLNGRRIARATRLSVGDQIQVGEITMTVRW